MPIQKEIVTQVGIIDGRDSIYLDEVEFTVNELIFKGKINGNSCTNNYFKKEWIKYTLKFYNTLYFDCVELDFNKIENQFASSFDLVTNSEIIKSFQNQSKKLTEQHSHYGLFTYDYIFQIIAKSFELTVS